MWLKVWRSVGAERLRPSEHQLALGDLLNDEEQLQNQLVAAVAKAKPETDEGDPPAAPAKAKPKGAASLQERPLFYRRATTCCSRTPSDTRKTQCVSCSGDQQSLHLGLCACESSLEEPRHAPEFAFG